MIAAWTLIAEFKSVARDGKDSNMSSADSHVMLGNLHQACAEITKLSPCSTTEGIVATKTAYSSALQAFTPSVSSAISNEDRFAATQLIIGADGHLKNLGYENF